MQTSLATWAKIACWSVVSSCFFLIVVFCLEEDVCGVTNFDLYTECPR